MKYCRDLFYADKIDLNNTVILSVSEESIWQSVD